MEPLDVMDPTDWIKDYDPLFDLFDEEMRMAEAVAGGPTPTASSSSTSAPWSQGNGSFCYPGGVGGTSSSHIGVTDNYHHALANGDYDLNQYYYPTDHCKPQQTDELSILLGIDWLPAACFNEFNSPNESSSAYSSSVPSPATSSTCGSSSNSTTTTNGTSNSINSGISISSNNGINAVNNSISMSSNNKVQVLSQQQQQKHQTIQQQASIALKKRKRKSIQAKGTSLLAQPSPKLINLNSTNSPIISTTTSSKSQSATLSLSSTLSKTATTTTITLKNANTITTSSIPIRNRTITAAEKTRRLLDLAYTSKLCATIEHSYALVRS